MERLQTLEVRWEKGPVCIYADAEDIGWDIEVWFDEYDRLP